MHYNSPFEMTNKPKMEKAYSHNIKDNINFAIDKLKYASK